MARVPALATVHPLERQSTLDYRRQLTEKLLGELTVTRDPDDRVELIERIVDLNLDLADSLARQYANRGLDLDDLTQVARIGLLLAVKRFRPGVGPSFSAFAIPTIRGELRRHFRDHGWVVRPPRRLQELRARARTQREELEQRLGRTPSSVDLAAALEVDPKEIQQCDAADSGFHPLSLEATLDDDDTPAVARLRNDVEELDMLPDLLALRRELGNLTERELHVLKWRFTEGLTQSEIGARLGVSQMQVSRILSATLARLRSALTPAEEQLAS